MRLPAVNCYGINNEPIFRDFRACNDGQFTTCGAEEVWHHDARVHGLAFIDEICQSLFDRWCERRNVVALAYLMHAWPLLIGGPHIVKRLLQSLRELKEHHSELLSWEERAMLRLILDDE